jgi:hypothetical protein
MLHFSDCPVLCNDTFKSCRYWEMEAEGFTGSFVTVYQTTRYHNLEDYDLNFYSRKNLISNFSTSVSRQVAAYISKCHVTSNKAKRCAEDKFQTRGWVRGCEKWKNRVLRNSSPHKLCAGFD